MIAIDVPIVQAPMAGGPSTPELAAAVTGAGGLGFVAGGYLSADDLSARIRRTRELTAAPFGVNVFAPSAPGDESEIADYARRLEPEALRLGAALGRPIWDDDEYHDKLALAAAERVALLSFTFGCPTSAEVDALRAAGVEVAVTVTSVAEAEQATAAGADAVVAQGIEAGGHQGSFLDLARNETSMLDLVREVRAASKLPVVASGGLMTGADVQAALDAGAFAAQLGTAFLLCPEAGTSPVYRSALADSSETTITRAFSGRYARGLVNRFAREYSPFAPQAYPEIHHLTRPLRVAATAAGDADVPNFWAGTGWRQARAEPAAEVVSRIAADLR
ncbi:MAG: NAD(P)H-dependent flavin oxidoreductase [Jatrophihabitans sp.]